MKLTTGFHLVQVNNEWIYTTTPLHDFMALTGATLRLAIITNTALVVAVLVAGRNRSTGIKNLWIDTLHLPASKMLRDTQSWEGSSRQLYTQTCSTGHCNAAAQQRHNKMYLTQRHLKHSFQMSVALQCCSTTAAQQNVLNATAPETLISNECFRCIKCIYSRTFTYRSFLQLGYDLKELTTNGFYEN